MSYSRHPFLDAHRMPYQVSLIQQSQANAPPLGTSCCISTTPRGGFSPLPFAQAQSAMPDCTFSRSPVFAYRSGSKPGFPDSSRYHWTSAFRHIQRRQTRILSRVASPRGSSVSALHWGGESQLQSLQLPSWLFLPPLFCFRKD